MPCRMDACSQGRKPCPRRRVCDGDEPEDTPLSASWSALIGWAVVLGLTLGAAFASIR